jgi:transcriptional regulator with XRE-family HTH domain
MPDLGPLIKSVREARQLTISAVAKRADLDVGFVSQLEGNHRKASAETLVKLATALEIPQRLLFYAAGFLEKRDIDEQSVDLAATFDRITKLESAFRAKLKSL